jgi:farnesol dehydrogenase
MSRLVLVTGASGYLGRRVAAALAARGDHVRAMKRHGKELEFPAELRDRVEIAEGDMLEPMTLDAALRGATHVVHCAALVKVWEKDGTLFDRVNVEGFAALLRRAQQAGVGKFVYMSSFMALGPTDGAVAGEDRPYPEEHRPRAPYERTKFIAEALARQYVRTGLPLVTLYPGVIYGPGAMTEGNLLGGILERYFTGRLPGLAGGGKKLWSFAFVDDVTAGILAALDRAPGGGRFLLAGENRSLREVFGLVTKWTGGRMPRSLPYWAVSWAASWQWLMAETLGVKPDITPAVLDIFRHDWAFTSERAERELGYRVTPFEEGLRRTLLWLRDERGLSVHFREDAA